MVLLYLVLGLAVVAGVVAGAVSFAKSRDAHRAVLVGLGFMFGTAALAALVVGASLVVWPAAGG